MCIRAQIRAKNISQKVQIISGAEDKMTPQKNAITLAENFDNVNLRVIQGTGHMLMIEKPTIITKELYNFTISNLII